MSKTQRPPRKWGAGFSREDDAWVVLRAKYPPVALLGAPEMPVVDAMLTVRDALPGESVPREATVAWVLPNDPGRALVALREADGEVRTYEWWRP